MTEKRKILRRGEPAHSLAELQSAGGCELHSGATLFWETNKAGGRTYSSDEIGGGVEVWDTALVSETTLMEAMAIERALQLAELRAYRQRQSQASAEFGASPPEAE
jgi:hypothetical protein